MVIILTFERLPVSQSATWRSLILLKPVVAMRSLSPIQTTRAPCTTGTSTNYRVRLPHATTHLDATVALAYAHGVAARTRVE